MSKFQTVFELCSKQSDCRLQIACGGKTICCSTQLNTMERSFVARGPHVISSVSPQHVGLKPAAIGGKTSVLVSPNLMLNTATKKLLHWLSRKSALW